MTRTAIAASKLMSARMISWFSCGAASACAAKIATERFGERVDVVYCDTMSNEHPDNQRFFEDVEKWIGRSITRTSNPKYESVEAVFEAKQYISGPKGAPCTAQLKKIPRLLFAAVDDIHIFGFTADEDKRINEFEQRNPELHLLWLLRNEGITKADCYRILTEAGIELPVMYKLGYRNNNCLGCVKATSPGYWQKVKRDFPEVFAARAEQSRRLGCRLVRVKGERMFLDEMPTGIYRYKGENISCGPECGIQIEQDPAASAGVKI